MEINEENYKIAVELIGKKAILHGGGQFMNGFKVVTVKGLGTEKGSLKVFDGKEDFEPFMWAWYLRPIGKDVEDLPEGSYLVTGGDKFGETLIRNQDCGIFGTIYQCSIAKRIMDRDIQQRREEIQQQVNLDNKMPKTKLVEKYHMSKKWDLKKPKDKLLNDIVENILYQEFNINNS